jgi:hypothetical protein
MASRILDHFADLPDPRRQPGRRHFLSDILAIAICAVVGGAGEFSALAEFGRAKRKWFKKFLRLPHGVPSADTFERVFARLDPEAFERCFMSWVGALAGSSDGELVAIDGKTVAELLRRTSFKATESAYLAGMGKARQRALLLRGQNWAPKATDENALNNNVTLMQAIVISR